MPYPYMRYLFVAGLVVGGLIFARGVATGDRAAAVLGGFAVFLLLSQVLAERLMGKGRLGWWLLLSAPAFLLKMPPAFFALMVSLMFVVVVLHFLFPVSAGDGDARK